MRAVAVTDVNRLAVVDVPEPSHGDGAIVSVDLSGICGTDLKIVRGEIPVSFPRVLGHEVVGRVVQPGPQNVVSAGTRVLVDPSISCGECRTCSRDLAHLCPNGALMGRDVDGGLAQMVAVDEDRLLPVPDAIDEDAAGLLQVLGTCVHAQTRLTTSDDDVAVVLGLGVSGLLHLQLLLERGVRRILGITRSETKRKLATQLGATVTSGPDGAQQALRDLAAGDKADIVVETAGAPDTFRLALELAGFGSQVLLFGITTSADDVPLYQMYYREVDLVWTRAARRDDYARGIELAASGRLDLAALATGSYPLEHADRAFDRLNRPNALKVTVAMP